MASRILRRWRNCCSGIAGPRTGRRASGCAFCAGGPAPRAGCTPRRGNGRQHPCSGKTKEKGTQQLLNQVRRITCKWAKKSLRPLALSPYVFSCFLCFSWFISNHERYETHELLFSCFSKKKGRLFFNRLLIEDSPCFQYLQRGSSIPSICCAATSKEYMALKALLFWLQSNLDFSSIKISAKSTSFLREPTLTAREFRN